MVEGHAIHLHFEFGVAGTEADCKDEDLTGCCFLRQALVGGFLLLEEGARDLLHQFCLVSRGIGAIAFCLAVDHGGHMF